MAWVRIGRTFVLLSCLVQATMAFMATSFVHASDTEILANGQDQHGLSGLWSEDNLRPLPLTLKFIKRSVGRIALDDDPRVSCTAFCVADDTVATASHCLFSDNATGPRLELPKVSIEFETNEGVVHTRIAGEDEQAMQWNIIAGTTRFPARAPLRNAHDWALVRLASKECTSRVVNFAPRLSDENVQQAIIERRIFSVGYMKTERGRELLMSDNCEAPQTLELLRKSRAVLGSQFEQSGDIVAHRCSMTRGASGSPLYVDLGEGPVVMALNNGTIPVPYYILTGKSHQRRHEIIRAMIEATNISVKLSAFIGRLTELGDANRRLSSREMRRLQQHLREQGHFAGPANGIYDSRLRQAILDYERQHKLPPTGRPAIKLFENPVPSN